MSIVGGPLNSHQKCIDACPRCFQACHEYAILCLQEPDVAQKTNHVGMMLKCAGLCQEAACLMTVNTEHAKEMCQLCATVCEKCVANCAQFKDEYCRQCANECRKYAIECKVM